MAAKWRPRSKLTAGVQLHLCGSLFTLDQELLASKSSTVCKLLKMTPQLDLSHALQDIPADQESMELVGNFCHGFTINLTPDNIVRVICVAHYLGMTDSHCPDNLLTKALLCFERQILPSWSNSIKALKSAENVLEQAIELSLVDYCVNSLLKMVSDDPSLLGEPIITITSNDEEENSYKPNVRRKRFDSDWKSEDLTGLSLSLYVPIIRLMVQRSISEEYIAGSICQYAKTWIFLNEKIGDNVLLYEANSQRKIVEAVESLLPDRKGVVPCSFLFEMLKHSIILDASGECRNRLEMRIGKQLDEACIEDLLIPCHGYAKDGTYDTECVRRILKNFYCNYKSNDQRGLNSVSELMDEFLAEIASDADLKVHTFVALVEMSAAASAGTQRVSDDLYRAINVYLEKHAWVTESEREEICKGLDCSRLSEEAREHAARNERLPTRVVVQVLFTSQLRLREVIRVRDEVKVEGIEEDRAREEMVRIERKVEELEKECGVMKKEIVKSNSGRWKKVSVWKAVKRKFGCGTSTMDDSNSHVKKKKKKVHPR